MEPEANNSTPQPLPTKEAIEAALRSEARFQNYFEGFLPTSVEQFISSYAQYKLIWLNHGEYNLSAKEKEEMQWINAASQHLEDIQQKKLFDAQCLWRAEQASFPGVEICFDFRLWEEDVHRCPFLEPVSPEEVDLYIQYLNSNSVDLDDNDWFEDWQDYEAFKEAFATNNGNRNFPEWYDFHNGRTGAGAYLSLPDIRGAKEASYIDALRQHSREANAEKHAAWERDRDKRPSLSFYDKQQLDFFVATFEDKQTQAYYDASKYNRAEQR